MKLGPADVANISSILNTCQIGGVESVIFADGKVRGMNEERSFVIISDYNIPNLPGKMGVSRLGTLKQRLDLYGPSSTPTLELIQADNGDIKTLNISAGKSKVQFRCTSPSLIKAPTSVNDSPTAVVYITSSELKTILDAIKVMGSKTLQIVIKSTGVASVSCNDETNDTFNIELETKAEIEGDSVIHYYFAQIFSTVLRQSLGNNVTALAIGEMGTISTKLHEHSVILMPKINDEGDDDSE